MISESKPLLAKNYSHFSRSIFRIGIFIFILVSIFSFNNYRAEAAACNATVSGTWTAAGGTATFVGCTGTGGAPGSADDLTINSGVVLTVDWAATVLSVTIANPTVANGLTIGSVTTGVTMTITNALTLSANSSTAIAETVSIRGANTLLNVGSVSMGATSGTGSNIITGLTVTACSGTGGLAASGAIALTGGTATTGIVQITMGACKVTAGTTIGVTGGTGGSGLATIVTTSGNITSTGVTTVTGSTTGAATITTGTGTISANGFSIVGGTVAGTVSTTGAGVLTTTSGVTFTGTALQAKLTMASAAATFNITGTVSTGGTLSLGALTTTKFTGTSAINGAYTWGGIVQVNTGTLTVGAFTTTFTGTTLVADGATLKIGGAAFTFTGAVTVGTGGAGGNLSCTATVSCTGLKTFSAGLTVGANGVFDMTLGTVVPSVTFAGTTSTYSHSGTTFKTGTGTFLISGTGAMAFAGSSNMIFGATMSIPTNRQITVSNTDATGVTIAALTMATAATANSVTINNGSNVVVTGALTFSANASATTQLITLGSGAGAGNLTVGSISMTGGSGANVGGGKIACSASGTGTLTVAGAGTIAITGSSSATNTGLMSIDMSAGACKVTTGTVAGTVLTLTGGTTGATPAAMFKMGSGTLTMNGNLAFGGTTASKAQFNMGATGGTIDLNGAILPAVTTTSGSYVFTSTTNLISDSTSAINYAAAIPTLGTCTVNSGTLTFGASAAPSCTSVVVASGATLELGTNLLTDSGNLTCGSGGAGTATISGSVGGILLSGASAVIDDAGGAGSTCAVTNSGTFTVSGITAPTIGTGATYTFTGPLSVSTLLTNSGTVNVDGGLVGAGNFVNAASSILNVRSAAAPTITTLTASTTTPDNTVNYTSAAPNCDVTAYDILNFTGSGTVTCAVTSVASNLGLSTAGTMAWTTGGNLTVGGILSVGNSVTLTQGAYTLDAANLTVGGGASGSFVGSAGAIGVTGNLLINAGAAFTSTSNILTTSGNFTNNGTFAHNSGTVSLSTSSTATISSVSSMSFNNFTASAIGVAKTIKFKHSTTGTPIFTFVGTVSLNGASGKVLTIDSDDSTNQWTATFANAASPTWVSVSNSGCSASQDMTVDSNSTLGANNGTCWKPPVVLHTLSIPASSGTGTGSYGGTAAGATSHGTAVSITASPDASSDFTSWTATGAAAACNGTTTSPCAFSMTSAASVTAVYTLKTLTLTYSVGSNGTVVGTSPQTVNYNASGTMVTATPNTGYHFVSWSDNSSTNPIRTDTAVTANITTTASFAINAPTAPVISNISPSSKAMNSAQFTLSVSGSNFISTSIIKFNGSARTTTFIDGTQLTAVIPATDLTTDGTFDITVTNEAPGNGTSNIYTFTIVDSSVLSTTSISPASLDSGGNSFVLTVNGTKFVSGSIIKWNGVAKSTTFINSTQLTAVIPATDIATAGTASVLVVNPSPVTESNAQTFTITTHTPPATKFVILNPTSSVVGGTVTVTVQAQNAGNTVATAYNNNVTLSASGNATGAGLINIVNGVGTIDITDQTAETVNLSLSDTQSTNLDVSSTQDLVFTTGPLFQYAISSPDNINAGTRAPYTVTRKDQYGNLASAGASTVHLYTNSSSGLGYFYNAENGGSTITSIIIADGASTANFYYGEGRVGTYSITVSDNSSAPDGATGIVDASDSISVSSGPTTLFTLNDPGNMSINNRLGYTVTRKDAFGNLATNGSNTVYLYSSSGSPAKAFYDAGIAGNAVSSIAIANGVSSADFWYFDDTEGIYTITTSDNASSPDGAIGIIDATDDVTVSLTPIVATKIIILNPNDSIVGNATPVTIKAVDDSGATDTSFNNTVTLNTSGGAIGGGIITLTSGSATVNINDQTTETVNLSLTDSNTTSLNASSVQDIIFTSGALAQYTISNAPDTTAGVRSSYTVSRKDRYGNPITSGISTVYLYTNSTGTLGKFYDSANGGNIIISVNINDGQSEAAFYYEEGTAGSWTVVVSDNNTAPDSATGIADATDPIIITPAVVHALFLTDPGNMSKNTRLGYTVIRKDIFGNLITTGTQIVYLFSSSTSAKHSFFDQVTGGTARTQIEIQAGQSSTDFWYFDDTTGLYTITATDNSSAPDGTIGIVDATDEVTVSSVVIVPTKIVIGSVPNTLVGHKVTVDITAQDDNGNIATTFSGNVTLVATGKVTGDGILHIVNGVGSLEISDSTAETSILSLNDSGNTNLNVDSSQVVVFSSVTVSQGGYSSSPVVVAPPVFAINFSGKASPGSLINIFGIPKGGNIAQKVILDQQVVSSKVGSFKIGLNDPDTKSGIYVVSFVDKNHISGQYKVFANLSNVSTLNNIVFAPTLSLLRDSIRKADFLSINGYATPNSVVTAQFDGKTSAKETATVGADGAYKILISTAALDLGRHTVRTRSTVSVKPSDYSLDVSFVVSNLLRPMVDLNNDGRLDIKDVNIFNSIWASNDPATRMKIDFNGDGKVDLQDLSIFSQALKR